MDNGIDFAEKRYTLPRNVFKNWVTMRKIIFSAVLLGAMASSAFADQTPAVASMAPPAAAVVTPAAEPISELPVLQHPLYFGLITGLGDTDWDKLVAEDGSSINATPSSASGTGVLVGGLVGYDLTQYIGFEAQYIRYPDSSVNFATDAQENPFLNAPAHMTSKTDYAAMIAKASVPFDDNQFSGFGEIGYALEMRDDVMSGNIHDFRPTFGFGMSYLRLEHWTLTLAFNYTPGVGTATVDTANNYIPYVYSGQFIVAYRI